MIQPLLIPQLSSPTLNKAMTIEDHVCTLLDALVEPERNRSDALRTVAECLAAYVRYDEDEAKDFCSFLWQTLDAGGTVR